MRYLCISFLLFLSSCLAYDAIQSIKPTVHVSYISPPATNDNEQVTEQVVSDTLDYYAANWPTQRNAWQQFQYDAAKAFGIILKPPTMRWPTNLYVVWTDTPYDPIPAATGYTDVPQTVYVRPLGNRVSDSALTHELLHIVLYNTYGNSGAQHEAPGSFWLHAHTQLIDTLRPMLYAKGL